MTEWLLCGLHSNRHDLRFGLITDIKALPCGISGAALDQR